MAMLIKAPCQDCGREIKPYWPKKYDDRPGDHEVRRCATCTGKALDILMFLADLKERGKQVG